jgi:hypothetical protein
MELEHQTLSFGIKVQSVRYRAYRPSSYERPAPTGACGVLALSTEGNVLRS